jgi:hypothetical protein
MQEGTRFVRSPSTITLLRQGVIERAFKVVGPDVRILTKVASGLIWQFGLTSTTRI